MYNIIFVSALCHFLTNPLQSDAFNCGISEPFSFVTNEKEIDAETPCPIITKPELQQVAKAISAEPGKMEWVWIFGTMEYLFFTRGQSGQNLAFGLTARLLVGQLEQDTDPGSVNFTISKQTTRMTALE